MKTEKRASSIDSAAANWAVRADRGMAPEDMNALNAWLQMDARHVGAFARAQAMLQPLSSGAAAVVSESRRVAAAPAKLPRRAILAVAAALVGGVFILQPAGHAKADSFTTAVGEVRTVPLTDGSRITLNTGTQVDVAIGDTKRKLALRAGEAFFEVAADKSRPFVVGVNSFTVKAVGTAFSVRRVDDRGIELVVHEGVVELKGNAGSALSVNASQCAFVAGNGDVRLVTLAGDALGQSLAWRDGKIAFTGETLGEAVRDFNRYNTVQIRLADANLERRKITGLFSSRDPYAFADAIARSFEGVVSVSGNRIDLTSR